MEIRIVRDETDNVNRLLELGAFGDDDVRLSKGYFRYRNTSFGHSLIKTMTAGGIATPVHFRRGGNIRKIFDFMHSKAYEDGVAVSILHPFSFTYYNMFGYEKVADHFIVKLPLRLIDFVPRRCNLVPATEDMLSDLVSVYSEFSKGRYLLFERKNFNQFVPSPEKTQTYIYYNNGKAESYITFSQSKTLATNHYTDTVMTVREMVYTSKESLLELFSFIRMFEGELDEIEFLNLSMCPEVDMILRHYTHTTYKLLPDIAAKIINTEEVLKKSAYPKKDGGFTLKVEGGGDGAQGTFKVEFGGGDSRVTRLTDSSEADIIISDLALSRLVYGYDAPDSVSINYINGIKVNKNADDFILAFPKKRAGIFEHF